MGSSLKSRLMAINAQNHQPTRQAAQDQGCAGPMLKEHRMAADPRLFHLSRLGLERMGFECAGFDVRRALFLDTETTGLSGGAGTVAFLVGVGWVQGEDFVVRQYLMPDYGAEPMMLSQLGGVFERFDWVVTFNGKSFDMPLLESRFTLNRMRPLYKEMAQMDLLHPARRAWKMRLKRCNLGTLEARILNHEREHDLPGSEVPQRYFDYLRTRDFALLEDILEHNRQDIVSLGALLCELCAVYDAPEEQQSVSDIYSLGRVLERRGEGEAAQRCYRQAAKPRPILSLQALCDERGAREANWALSMMLKRSGEIERAEQIWIQMCERGQMGVKPYVERLKLLEHRHRRYQEAISLCDQALQRFRDPEEQDQLTIRRQRLLKKYNRSMEG